MLILLARRRDAEFAIGDITNNNATIGLRQDKARKEAKEQLAIVDKDILELNLGNMDAIIDLDIAQKNKNKTDEEATATGLYRVEIAQQELDIIRNKNEALLGGLSIQEQVTLLDDQQILNQLMKNNGDITEQDAKKKGLELTGKQISLEQKLGQVKMKTASDTLGALAQLAQSGKATFELGKALAIAEAVINTYSAGNKVLNSNLPYPTNVIAMLGVIATGLGNVGQIRSQKFEQGGLVGGRRHSQGGTTIEAEKGEFVMSRNAVDSIGINNLEQMNRGSGGGITFNISAPLVDETIIDTIIPAIEKAQRMNLA